MDLDLTEQQQAFREEVRSWLEANVPAEPLPPTTTEEGFAAHKAWEKTLFEAGYAAIHWPEAYGGRDADLIDTAIFQEEYARSGAPGRINVLGLGLAGPTLVHFGTDEQKQQWLPGILSADDIWCQGFSEPDAGSDLANIRTTAVREGDEYVVNGQKIWTSLGRFADWIFALVRTDRDAPKHKGITYVMIDMHSPGIEVRPITQINEEPGFAEVFFTDVRVPVANVIGEENDGWRVAMATLGFERGTGLGSHVRFSQNVQDLVEVVKAMGLDDDPLIRDQVARVYAESEVYRHNMYRTLTRLAGGKPIGPEASLNKLFWSEMEVRIFELGMRAMGPYAELKPKAQAARDRLAEAAGALEAWQKTYWYSRASCIYAGTSEIQKNIISERVLGLPKEPRSASGASAGTGSSTKEPRA
jgi:alkylation response protein AidB-like acyl-CoA dehydrogenase